MFIGVELVLNWETLDPAPNPVSYIIERMKDLSILLSTDGLYHNVLKIKPALVFTSEDALFLSATLDEVLKDTVLQVN